MPVGMFSSTMAWSLTPSRYFTSARRLLPCAAISTRLPCLMAGAIVSCQYGRKRATVSFSDSDAGISAGVALVLGRERRGWDVVAPAPDLDLVFAMLRRGFRLVQALQCPVVPL